MKKLIFLALTLISITAMAGNVSTGFFIPGVSSSDLHAPGSTYGNLPLFTTSSDSALSLGTSTAKTQVIQTGTDTVTSTAHVSVAQWTVTAGKTLYLTHLLFQGLSTQATNGLVATCSLEIPFGMSSLTVGLFSSNGNDSRDITLAEPIFVNSGVNVVLGCSPTTSNSTTVKAFFTGYERLQNQ